MYIANQVNKIQNNMELDKVNIILDMKKAKLMLVLVLLVLLEINNNFYMTNYNKKY